MFKQIKIFILIFFTISLVYGANVNTNNTTIYIKAINFKGAVNKKELIDLKKISKQYINKKLNLKDIKKLKNRLSSYFKNKGLLFTKVILPSQDLTRGSLSFYVMKTKVKNIEVKGNKYFSTKFIKRVFGFKNGEYLQYDKMLRNILFLNSYQDMSVKSYLKKGSDFGTTDVALNVKDTKPFHTTVTLDNLGSKDTSKYRVSADVNYGNLISDGDEMALRSTLGLKSLDTVATDLLILNYSTLPLGDYFTKINIGYMYANYVATGDLSVLDLQGSTNIYTIGLKQPLYYSTTLKSDLYLTYYKKHSKSYLLGELSTKDRLNLTELKFDFKYSGLANIFTSSMSVSKGISSNNTLQSRLDSDSRFTKYSLTSSYTRYINPKNSLNISLNSQYTTNRLPLSELFTIGGFSSVRGFSSAQKLGDSGLSTSLEWFYHPKIDYLKQFKNSTQIGFFVDYGKIFNNRPVPGEEDSSFLSALGAEIIVNINKKYFGRISIGFPLHASDSTVEKSTQVYGYIGMKLW